MAAKKSNQNNVPPWTMEKVGEAVYPLAFENGIHIFWGPGQLTIADTPYSPPDRKAWHSPDLLTIPQVTRFIYASSSTYDSDSFPPPGPPPVNDEWWQVIKLTDHIPPFASDCMVYLQRYVNGVPHIETATYSEAKFALEIGTGNLKPVWGQFELGMKFRLLYPAAAPIDYRYQNPDGFPQDGFYTRVGGIHIVPF